jgi:hypothetical protein
VNQIHNHHVVKNDFKALKRSEDLMAKMGEDV